MELAICGSRCDLCKTCGMRASMMEKRILHFGKCGAYLCSPPVQEEAPDPLEFESYLAAFDNKTRLSNL